MLSSTPSDVGLIVPVDVVAFCVNAEDQHNATPYFSGTTTVFTDQTGQNQAFVGANVNRDLLGTPAHTLEAGVHLHWALPDGLTHATSDSPSTGANTNAGGPAFKAVPNRWLVSRFSLQGGEPTRKSWVVSSDALNMAAPAGQVAITLPTHAGAEGQHYRFAGEWQEFDAGWDERLVATSNTFAALTGFELSAVANGQPSFSAFYPDCRSVFGFVDTLQDLNIPDGQQIELMYTVTGWFSQSSNDALHAGLNVTQLQTDYGWTFNSVGAVAPDYSLYNGTVQGLIWHPGQAYSPDHTVTPPEVHLEVAIGNSPSETASAYLTQKTHPDLPYCETLLNAYFQGLLHELQVPTADQLTTLEEKLYEKQFAPLKAGYVYTVAQKVVTRDSNNNEIVTYVEADNLPPALGDALNLLNSYAQANDLMQASLASFKWQLFAEWYRMFMVATAQQQQQSFEIANAKYAALDDQNQQLGTSSAALTKQLATVAVQLPPDCVLKHVPAPRYWQPNQPVLLIGGSDLPPAERYGGDGRYTTDGTLVCRLSSDLLTSVTVGTVTVPATDFAAQSIPLPNSLPHPDVFNALIEEACLLDTTVLTAKAGTTLTPQELTDALSGKSGGSLSFSGSPPSLVGLNWWNGNPWLPLFMCWSMQYQPLLPTSNPDGTGVLAYPQSFFSSQFTVDVDGGGGIDYQPATDPSTAPFTQYLSGVAVLSASPVRALIKQLSTSTDPTLVAMHDLLQSETFLMQAISGLNAAFLMQSEELQLNIRVPDDSEYVALTQAIADALGGYANVAPNFNGRYNPIRAGYLKVDLTLVDAFGQRRPVTQTSFTVAAPLQAQFNSKPLPSIVWLPPRLVQPSRLLLRWIAADSTHLDEMNQHPATTPICGWLLPNHVDGSLFVYDAQGASLGTLFLNGNQTAVMWQSAPGNDQTINEDVATVMQSQQPQLRDLVLALANGGALFFQDFARALDAVNGTVQPQANSTSNNLSVLIGRPIAVAQVSLGLELQGTPYYDQSTSVLNLDDSQFPFCETEAVFTQVTFPVVLGNLNKLDDGLIGYYKQTPDRSAYDFTHFYTAGAAAGSKTGVVPPSQNTLELTAYPVPQHNSDDGGQYKQKALLLIDPRAYVYASTGILPRKSIRIPPSQFTDTLRTLEMTFFCTPLLQGSSAFSLPLPAEQGYQWSWVEEEAIAGRKSWLVNPDVTSPMPRGLWTYTPQLIVEGWARLNPQLLGFDFYNADGKPVVTTGQSNALTLKVTNKQGRDISFAPGTIVQEGSDKSGSLFYIHFGTAVAQTDVPSMQLSATGWSFACLNDTQYGAYWAATPASGAACSLASGGELDISVGNVIVNTGKQQIAIVCDYYKVAGLNDGVHTDTLTVQQP